MSQPNRKSVEETGVPGVVAIAARRAPVTEVPASLRDGIEKELAKAMLLVQRELAELEGGISSQAATARALRRLARLHRTIHFMLDGQRLELEALERRLEVAASVEVAS